MNTTTSLLERGICRPYTGANQVVLTGDNDCCDNVVTCQDSITIADNAVVQGIVYVPACGPNAGEDVAITFPSTATNLTAVVAAVKEALLPYEFNVFVTGENSSSNFILRHQGQGTLKSLTIGGSPSNATRLCTVNLRCDYKGSIGGTTSAIVVNGTSRAFGADVVYGTTSAATAASTIQTAVDLGSITGGATVTVVDNTEQSTFDVTISSRQGSTFTVDTVEFEESNCQKVFEA